MIGHCHLLERRVFLDDSRPGASPLGIQPATAVTIDLLAVYTPAAKNQWGSDANISNAIQRAVDAINQAMDNSAIGISIRLVRAEQINYVSNGDLYLDRTRLENPADTYIDAVHSLRNTWGADLVTLIVEAGSGGNASLMTDIASPTNSALAFSALAWNSIGPDNNTLAHELGHTLGAGHERDNPFQLAVGPFGYSLGYRFNSKGNVYHDIMSYDPGIRVPYFANPAVSYYGAATGSNAGNADEADLAKTFEVTAPIVAAYRSSVVTDTTSPKVELFETHRHGEVLSFTLRYIDDSGVDISTIDSDDVTVTVPDGFVLAAGLQSVQHPTVGGGTKYATYRVMLPMNHPTTASLVFNLKPTAIKDIRGNFAAAGAITKFAPLNESFGLATAQDFGNLNEEVSAGSVLEKGHNDQTYRFTLTSAQTISVRLKNLLANANVFLVKDENGNGEYDGGVEGKNGSFNADSSDESFTANLSAGTYYLWVYNFTPNVNNYYSLTLSRYVDSIVPAAILDAPDITTTGTTHFTFRVGYLDDREMDAAATRYYSPIRLTNPFGGYYIYFGDSIDSDLNGPIKWVTYRVQYGPPGVPIPATDNGTYTVSTEPQNSPVWGANPLSDSVHDGAGNKLVPTTIGTFKVGIGLADATAPTAFSTPRNIIVGNISTYDFTVTYKENASFNASTVDGNDIRVTGPGGFNQPASLVSLSPAVTGSALHTATYRITAPGGLWDTDDNGSYSLIMQSAQVKDTANNSVATGIIASFTVHVHLPGDATLDNKVDTEDFNLLGANFGLRGRGFAEGDFNYDGIVESADFNLLAGNYARQIPASSSPAPALFGDFGTDKHLDKT